VCSFAKALALVDAMDTAVIGAATPGLEKPWQRLRAVFTG
jgi:hypothetical protein